MNLNDAKEIILNTEDIKEIQRVEIELTEQSSRYFRSLLLPASSLEKTEIKADLSLATILLTICKERKEYLKINGQDHNRFNYNFRMAAKTMLSKDSYNKIYEKATLTRREIKKQIIELKKDKFKD